MTERRRGARAPKGYRPSDYPPFAVTVDMVILSVVDAELRVLLVERKADPFAGAWALPGGFKRPDETLDEAAARELREETGVRGARLVQFGAYGDPGRDPRLDVVTVAYVAVVADVGQLRAGTDAAAAALWPVADVIDGRLEVAFDHRRVVTDAVDRVRVELETSNLAAAFVPEEFTMSELRSVYETVWETRYDPANFRRSFLSEQVLEPTGRRSQPSAEGGRPPELYRSLDSWESSPVRRPRVSARPRLSEDEAKEAVRRAARSIAKPTTGSGADRSRRAKRGS